MKPSKITETEIIYANYDLLNFQQLCVRMVICITIFMRKEERFNNYH